MIPRNDISLGVEAGALVHDEGKSIVLPSHFIFSRELDAHRFANGLREKSGIVGNRVGAVDPVAPRASPKNHAHILGLQAEKYGQGGSLMPDSLRWRPHLGFIILHIGDGA